MGQKGVSQRAFARAMGVTVRAVQKAIETERISTYRDGSIDPVKARAEWSENTDHNKRHRAKDREPVPEGKGLGPSSPGYQQARAVKETLQARLLDLKVQQQTGALLSASEVKKAVFETARKTRDALLAMPTRVAPLLAGRTIPECVRILDEEIGRVCDEIARFGGSEPPVP